MSRPHFPPEILDHLIDHLYDDPGTLTHCCLVSKSWVPRTRKYLFGHVEFRGDGYRRWNETFPDPVSSPAYHTHTLTVDGGPGGVEEGGWIRSFSLVERLIVESSWSSYTDHNIILTPFRELAPSLKSLYVISRPLPYPQIFDLVRFLPLLKDLILSNFKLLPTAIGVNESNEPPTPVSSTSPALTGTLSIFGNMTIPVRMLQDLPGGLHFRRFRLIQCWKDDFPSTAELVASCSNTLQYLDVTSHGMFVPPPSC